MVVGCEGGVSDADADNEFGFAPGQQQRLLCTDKPKSAAKLLTCGFSRVPMSSERRGALSRRAGG
jgi:hypothetical protein